MARTPMTNDEINRSDDLGRLEEELTAERNKPGYDLKSARGRALRARIKVLQRRAGDVVPDPNSAPASEPARTEEARPARRPAAGTPAQVRTRQTRTRRTTNGARGQSRTTETVTESTTQVGTGAAPAVQPAAATPAPATNNIVIPPVPPTPPAAAPAAQPAATTPPPPAAATTAPVANQPCPDDRPRRRIWPWVLALIVLLLLLAGLAIVPLINAKPPQQGTLPGGGPNPGPAPVAPQGPSYGTARPSELIVEPQPKAADGIQTFSENECRRHYLRQDYDWTEFWHVEPLQGDYAPKCHDHSKYRH